MDINEIRWDIQILSINSSYVNLDIEWRKFDKGCCRSFCRMSMQKMWHFDIEFLIIIFKFIQVKLRYKKSQIHFWKELP